MKRYDLVTIWYMRRIHVAAVWSIDSNGFSVTLADGRDVWLRREDEDLVWALGWDTPEANALRTAHALDAPP